MTEECKFEGLTPNQLRAELAKLARANMIFIDTSDIIVINDTGDFYIAYTKYLKIYVNKYSCAVAFSHILEEAASMIQCG